MSAYPIDLDGDGDVDVLYASSGDDTVAACKNDGSEITLFRYITGNAEGANAVFSIDVDGDGSADVLSTSSLDDTVAWYQTQDVKGSQTFSIVTISTLADQAASVFAIDVDDDGDVDVMSASVGGRNIRAVAWYENDGAESFAERIMTTLADGATSVFAIDADGDGDADAPTTTPTPRPSSASPSYAPSPFPSGEPSLPPSAEPSSASPSYRPSTPPSPEPSSATPSYAPSSPPTSAAPSSAPTPACVGRETLYRVDLGPDEAAWTGVVASLYQGQGTGGAVLQTFGGDGADLVRFYCREEELCATLAVDFGDAPSDDLFFRVSPWKNCAWVGGFPSARCLVVGADERLAHEACRELRLLRAAVGRADAAPDDGATPPGADDAPSPGPTSAPTAPFLRIESVGVLGVCVAEVPCAVDWSYRGPPCDRVRVSTARREDSRALGSFETTNDGRAVGTIPGGAAVGTYLLTVSACSRETADEAEFEPTRFQVPPAKPPASW
ncbi:hypothetical protein JL720_711 [Aureococcus anophagefferens]|nr:hypothetical protein JL720_711 [Aureococcus anophagefferens]